LKQHGTGDHLAQWFRSLEFTQ